MSRRVTKRGVARAWLDAHINHTGDDCLYWPFSTNSSGYGCYVLNGRMTSAHRAMCILSKGDPEPGLEAAHNCGNRLCCNPRHLRWATPKENRADKEIHGTVNRGSRNGIARLTDAKVISIRRMVANGALHRDAAVVFGVSRETVGEIVRRERWTHI